MRLCEYVCCVQGSKVVGGYLLGQTVRLLRVALTNRGICGGADGDAAKLSATMAGQCGSAYVTFELNQRCQT
jgi:hypothetical protein